MLLAFGDVVENSTCIGYTRNGDVVAMELQVVRSSSNS